MDFLIRIFDLLSVLYFLSLFIVTPILLIMAKHWFHAILLMIFFVLLLYFPSLFIKEIFVTGHISEYPKLIAIWITYIALFTFAFLSLIIRTAKGYARKVIINGGLIGFVFGGIYLFIIKNYYQGSFELLEILIAIMTLISTGWFVFWIIILIKQDAQKGERRPDNKE